MPPPPTRDSMRKPPTSAPVRSISGTKRGRPEIVPARVTSTSAAQVEHVTTAFAFAGRGVWQAGQRRFNGNVHFNPPSKLFTVCTRAGVTAGGGSRKAGGRRGFARGAAVASRLRNGQAHAVCEAPGPRDGVGDSVNVNVNVHVQVHVHVNVSVSVSVSVSDL
jgi:hypothetical protein